MRILILSLVLPFAARAHAHDSINAVLGDASWFATHGGSPDGAGETDRIRTHLLYVVRMLRAADTSDLSRDQRARRSGALDALVEYAAAGIFPRRGRDPYGGRRPRFIDDRGVHCAVGELIRRSGAPELAISIRDAYEYAYVTEIDAPQLRAWANANGFTTRELAMIQPSYAAIPTANSARQEIEWHKDPITLVCAPDYDVPRAIGLHLHGDENGRVAVTASDPNDEFARCFAEHMLIPGGDAYDESPRPFHASITIGLNAPRVIFQRALDQVDFGPRFNHCVPRPGAVPHDVTIHARVDSAGLAVDAVTQPRNEEADACYVRYARERLADFRAGRWTLEAHKHVEVGPAMTRQTLESGVTAFARRVALGCRSQGAPAQLHIEVRAVLDAPELDVEAKDGSAEFRACVADQLRQQLRTLFQIMRTMPSGETEPYFRIDATVSVTHLVQLGDLPAQTTLR